MKKPQGWEHHYNNDEVLKLKSCLYCLKQVAMACWHQLLKCMKDIDRSWSTEDPCLYLDWTEDRLTRVVSWTWIDDNLIVGN